MNTQQAIIFTVIGLTFGLLIWGRWRHDVVAVFALLLVVFSGLVPADEAFAGFSHPAVITVAAVLIISKGLQNAGLVDLVAKLISGLRGKPDLQIAAQCTIIAALSAFMNNVGALALMLPVALRNAYRESYAPARSLMPLAFASLLGGLTTMIGTPPNIIISTYRAQATGQPFGMFDFTPAGVAIAAAGLLFLAAMGKYLLPQRNSADAAKPFEVEGYVAEAEVPADSEAIGRTVHEIEEKSDNDITVAAIIQKDERRLIPSGFQRIAAGDILVLRGDTGALQALIEATGLTLIGNEDIEQEDLRSDDIGLVEVVVSPVARIVGATPISLALRTVFGLNMLAIARHGHRIEQRLGHVVFQSGDVMLLQGPKSEMPRVLGDLGLLPLAERSLDLGRQQRLTVAAAIFGAAIVAILAGALPAHVAFTAAAALYVITDIVKTSEIYSSIDWPVIVLLGALFPVASAMETSGATALIADSILRVSVGYGPAVALLVILVATMFISDIINNNATALLMAPIGVTIASRLGVSADTFLMAVAIGASCAFLTPIGHQSNMLVMEPGGYRFGDYWRVGLPLEIVIALTAMLALAVFWPLR